MLTLVLTDTLRGGWVRGAAVAAGPLLADGPIIALSLALMVHLPAGFERGMSAAGGVFLLYLAAATLRESRSAKLPKGGALPARSGLLTGLLARALSPHPYLFWLVVGAPLLLQASRASWIAAAAFLLGYYSTIIGSNVVLALAIHRGAGLLSDRGYRAVLLGSGAVLATFGLALLAGGFGFRR